MSSSAAPQRQVPRAVRRVVVACSAVAALGVAALIAFDITVIRTGTPAPLPLGGTAAWIGIGYCIAGGIYAWVTGWRLVPAVLLISGVVGVLLACAQSLVNYAVLFSPEMSIAGPAYLVSIRLVDALPLVIELAILVLPDGRLARGWPRAVSGISAALTAFPVLVRLAMPWPDFFAANGAPDPRLEAWIPEGGGIPLPSDAWRVLAAMAQPSLILGVLLAVVVLAARLARTSAALQESTHIRRQLLTAREDARRRLRRDLHDGLGPMLAGVQLRVGAARNVIDRDPQRADALLDGVLEQLRLAVDEIRRITRDLPPAALGEIGLERAIEGICRQFEIEDARTVQREFSGLGRLSPEAELVAYRIASEALHNAHRHARAQVIRVRIVCADGSCVIEVVDDGVGVDLAALEAAEGIGIRSMRERAEAIGGTLRVGRRAGGGTAVRAVLPCGDEARLESDPSTTKTGADA